MQAYVNAFWVTMVGLAAMLPFAVLLRTRAGRPAAAVIDLH